VHSIQQNTHGRLYRKNLSTGDGNVTQRTHRIGHPCSEDHMQPHCYTCKLEGAFYPATIPMHSLNRKEKRAEANGFGIQFERRRKGGQKKFEHQGVVNESPLAWNSPKRKAFCKGTSSNTHTTCPTPAIHMRDPEVLHRFHEGSEGESPLHWGTLVCGHDSHRSSTSSFNGLHVF
jgi:hypothetical protein